MYLHDLIDMRHLNIVWMEYYKQCVIPYKLEINYFILNVGHVHNSELLYACILGGMLQHRGRDSK